VIETGKSNGIGRSVRLALALGAGLALGACSTMADMGEATAEGVSKVANAANPFNWFGSKDKDDAEPKPDTDAAQRARLERSVASTAPKTGPKSAARDDLAQRQAIAQDEERYPKLSTVPDRPKDAKSKRADQTRAKLREGLVADTANAQYSDKELRAQTTPPAAPQGQPDLARSNERVAGEPPAVPAPTMPVTATPVAPIATPVQAPVQAPAQTAMAPSVPRVAPPPVNPPRAPLAAASAAPVAPVAAPSRPTPPMPQGQRQAALTAPAPAPAPETQSVLKTVQVATIYFNDGSTRLSANDRRLVDQIAEAARRTGGTLRIIGHASMGAPSRDPDRTDMINYKVSLERANAVAAELARSGVPGPQMQVVGEGARSPIYAETSKTGAAGNRRTEVYLDFYERL
jgi:outer membrane protein OmpA-like peptidoglycan-associated protein